MQRFLHIIVEVKTDSYEMSDTLDASILKQTLFSSFSSNISFTSFFHLIHCYVHFISYLVIDDQLWRCCELKPFNLSCFKFTCTGTEHAAILFATSSCLVNFPFVSHRKTWTVLYFFSCLHRHLRNGICSRRRRTCLAQGRILLSESKVSY